MSLNIFINICSAVGVDILSISIFEFKVYRLYFSSKTWKLFVHIDVLDVQTAIENAKLVILEQLVLKMFLPPHNNGGVRPGHFCWENFLVIYKNQNFVYVFHDFFDWFYLDFDIDGYVSLMILYFVDKIYQYFYFTIHSHICVEVDCWIYTWQWFRATFKV